MFDMKGVRKITPDERTFALCFARTMSVRQSCAAAGFKPPTSFARASRLLERDDVRAFVRASILDEKTAVFPDGRADPAPVGSVGEARSADVAPVSLENVRDASAPKGGEPAAESGSLYPSPAVQSPPAVSTPLRTGVPAPSAAENEDGGAPCASPDDSGESFSLEREERRILSEYEKIAFAPATKESDLKVADKLRALEQYRAIVERQAQRVADGANAARLAERNDRLTVVYDYGDEREPR